MQRTGRRGSIALAIFGSLILGITVNRVDEFVVKQFSSFRWTMLHQSISVPIWLLLTVCIFFTSFSIFLFQRQNFIIKSLENLNQLDDHFWSSLTSLDALVKSEEQNLDEIFKNILDDYFLNASKIFEIERFTSQTLNRCSVLIYKPEKEQIQKYLYAWYGCDLLEGEPVRFSTEKIQAERFPLNRSFTSQGWNLIEKNFFAEKPSDAPRCCSSKHDTQYTHSDVHYSYMPNWRRRGARKTNQSEEVWAAIPLLRNGSNEKMGVLCFRTRNTPTLLKHEQFQEQILPMLSNRISSAMQIKEI